jgi:predicted ester cyclase
MPRPCFIASLVQSSNSVWPFRSRSSSRIARLAGAASAWPAENVVHHDPYDPHAADGLVGLRKSIEANRTTFPDMRIEVEDQVAERDRVATRWLATMTHPEAGRVEMRGITIERFEDGKVVESWRSMDMLGMLRQIGAR